jgi:hypothetical protein
MSYLHLYGYTYTVHDYQMILEQSRLRSCSTKYFFGILSDSVHLPRVNTAPRISVRPNGGTAATLSAAMNPRGSLILIVRRRYKVLLIA